MEQQLLSFVKYSKTNFGSITLQAFIMDTHTQTHIMDIYHKLFCCKEKCLVFQLTCETSWGCRKLHVYAHELGTEAHMYWYRMAEAVTNMNLPDLSFVNTDENLVYEAHFILLLTLWFCLKSCSSEK
jgi:hypothetical protein